MRRAAGPLLAMLAAVLLLVPIAIVVALSFNAERSLHFPPTHLSLRWYARFLGDPGWRAALGSSLGIASMAAGLATLAGFPAAYALARMRAAPRRWLTALVLLPMIVPHIIAAVALYALSVRLGWVGQPLWIAAVHAALGLPVVVLVTGASLSQLDAGLERAALGLGASPSQVVLRVVLPLAAPGVASGALFAFLSSFDELTVALFLSGARSQTLPVRIWNSLSLELEPTVAAVSATLVLLAAVVLALSAALRARPAALTPGAAP